MVQSAKPRIRFAVIGINHAHIYSQVGAVLRGGGELVWLYAKEPDLVKAFQKRFPQAKVARSEEEILEDACIQLVLSAAIPDERAPLGIRVMQHGKDYMADKPGITTLEQLAEVRRVQAADQAHLLDHVQRAVREPRHGQGRRARQGRRHRPRGADRRARPAPHEPASRPAWFFEKSRYGGILCDIASHQADQFLYFTGSTRAEVVACAGRQRAPPAVPGVRGLRRHDAARRLAGPGTSAWTGSRRTVWRPGATGG